MKMAWKNPAIERWAYTERGIEIRRILNKEWYTKNRKHRNAYMRAWNARNSERLRPIKKASRDANPLREFLYKAKNRANKLGLEFSLTAADFPSLPKICPVLGIDLVYGGNRQSDGSPTLDRIDNDKGYVSGNVIIVSWRANDLKSDATIGELVAIAKFYEKYQGGV